MNSAQHPPLSSRFFDARHTGGCRTRRAAVWMVLALSWPSVMALEQPQTGLPMLAIQAGMHLIQAQVAATPDQRATGLMYRRDMPPNEGMLFVFDVPAIQCFWMKNTLLPLTAAFVADDGTIVNLADMKPQTLDSHCSTKPVRYVLEMNQGWFSKRNIQSGYRLTGPLFVSQKIS